MKTAAASRLKTGPVLVEKIPSRIADAEILCLKIRGSLKDNHLPDLGLRPSCWRAKA